MELPIPDEMRRKARPVDPNFSPDEDLYIRFQNLDGEKINPLDIRYPDQSVNRSKYSQPEWVLLPKFEDWGYGAFEVRDVPPSITSETNVTHYLAVEHVPLDENYSHSEVRSYKNGKRVKQKQRKVGLLFRVRISQRARVLKKPSKTLLKV